MKTSMSIRNAISLLFIVVIASLGGTTGQAGEPGETASPAAVTKPATYGGWHSCQIGGGGYVMNVVTCPDAPLRLYSYIDVGGVYRSEDGGKRWRMMNSGLPPVAGSLMVRGLSVDPRDSLKFVIVTGGQWGSEPGEVYRTEDGGETYQTVLKSSFVGGSPDRADGLGLVRDPHNPDILLAASVLDGVWKSVDGGKTWASKGLKGIYGIDLRYDRQAPGLLRLCGLAAKRRVANNETMTQGGFYESRDNGETWEKLSDTAPAEIAQTPADPDALYGLFQQRPAVSRDNGKTWNPLNDGLPPATQKSGDWQNNSYRAFAAGPDFLVCGRGNGDLFRYDIAAKKWSPVPRERIEETYEGRPWYKTGIGDFGKAMSSIVIDPANPAHWFVTDWFAIYQTHDSGKTWALTIDGMEITVIHCFEQDPSDPKLVHLGMADNGYFRSVDGGETFRQVNWKKGINNNIKCIVVAQRNPQRVYAVGPRQWHWEANQVFLSDDKGENWKKSPMKGLPDMGQHHCNSLAVGNNPQQVFIALSGKIGEGGGIYRSEDGGQSWQPDNAGLPQGASLFQHGIWHYGRELVVDEAGNAMAISGIANAMYARPAGAKAWSLCTGTRSGKPNALIALPGAAGAFLMAGMDGGVLKTTDAGATWRKLLDKRVFHVAADRNRPERLLASVDKEGVYYSKDGGEHWQLLDPKLPYRLLFTYVGFAGDRALAGTDGCGAFWINLP